MNKLIYASINQSINKRRMNQSINHSVSQSMN